MLKCDLNKVALRLHWNSTSAWLVSYKFAACFQNTTGGLFLIITSWRCHLDDLLLLLTPSPALSTFSNLLFLLVSVFVMDGLDSHFKPDCVFLISHCVKKDQVNLVYRLLLLRVLPRVIYGVVVLKISQNFSRKAPVVESSFNPSHVTGLFLYLKTSENLCFLCFQGV